MNCQQALGQTVGINTARCWYLRLIFLTMALFLASCRLSDNKSMLPNAADDYLEARTLKPLVVPPTLDSQAVRQVFSMPAIETPIVVEDSTVPPPPRLIIKKDIPRVSIQQLGDKRWILAAQPTAKIWPLVVNFLETNRLTLASKDIDKGILETDWLALSIDPGNVNKYVLRVDSGVQPDTTEIHILNHVRANDKVRASVQWTQVSTDDTRENWMINELVEMLISESDLLPGESLLAQNVGSRDKVYLRQRPRELVLAITLDRQRAYASLVGALAQSGDFVLYQQDSAQGIFHIDYPQMTEEEQSTGFTFNLINKLNPFTAGEPPASQYTLEDIISHLPEQSSQIDSIFSPQADDPIADVLDNVPGYLIVIKERDTEQIVYIRDGYGKPLPLSQSKRLLTLIRRQLI